MMLYQDRPRIKLKLTSLDKFLELMGLGLILFMWTLVISSYALLPHTIPTHFNAFGEVDAYSSKGMIWVLLLISSLIYLGMTVLAKYPYLFNYSVKITQENAFRQYTLSVQMIRYVKLVILLMMTYLLFKTINISLGGATGLNTWFLFLFLGLLFGLVAYFTVISFLKK